MRRRWPIPGDDLLVFDGKEWFITLLYKCSDDIQDMLIMLIWRIWQIRNDMTHGKDAPPVLATVEYLHSYYKSIKIAGHFSTEVISKGKMPSSDIVAPTQYNKVPAAPWPAPAGKLALSVDGSFLEEDRSASVGMVLRTTRGRFCWQHNVLSSIAMIHWRQNYMRLGKVWRCRYNTLSFRWSLMLDGPAQ